MLENAKSLLLPLLEGLNKALPAIIASFKSLMSSGLAEGIKSAAKLLGGIVGKVINLFTAFPKTMTVIALALMGPGGWILNGLSLAKGFMMGSRGFGAGAGGGVGGAAGGAAKANMQRHAAGTVVNGKNVGGQMYNAGPKVGKFKMSGGARMGAGIGLGLGAAGLSMARGGLDNQNSAGGKALGVGSAALTGAAMGMMIGPIGALVGGILGAAYGAYSEYGGPGPGVELTPSAPADDAILADGKITPINSKDEVFQVSKPGGAFDKAGVRGSGYSGGKITPIDSKDEVFQTSKPSSVREPSYSGGKITPIDSKDQVFQLPKPSSGSDKAGVRGPSSSGGSGGGTTHVKVSFDNIIVKSDSNVGKIDLENDSVFMQMLGTKIKEAMNKTANGGVLSPNPS